MHKSCVVNYKYNLLNINPIILIVCQENMVLFTIDRVVQSFERYIRIQTCQILSSGNVHTMYNV